MKLGLICRMDVTGLGNQTRNLARMLNPDKVMLIDSTPFNGNAQHPEWYAGYDQETVIGFPTSVQCEAFLDGLTHVITCEIPYNYDLFTIARRRGIRSYLQYNWEFLDYLRNLSLPTPDYFLAPSTWHLNEMKAMAPGRVELLPPPLHMEDYQHPRMVNLGRRTKRRRLLHIVGRRAVHDRNGTDALVAALKHTSTDFELVIKAQAPLEYSIDDKRVTFDYSSPANNADLYVGFDALVMPRRYGGLCLPMNEALASGLPVLMSDIEPNSAVLLPSWLIATQTGSSVFMARSVIAVTEPDPVAIAARIDEVCSWSFMDKRQKAEYAVWLASDRFAATTLLPKYKQALEVNG